jgi:predicted transcriptional regulator
MATMNFSIPDDVKERFNQVFAGANKSAVVARLMEDAIEQAERRRRSNAAVRRVLKRRKNTSPASNCEILLARDELRAQSDAGHRLKSR